MLTELALTHHCDQTIHWSAGGYFNAEGGAEHLEKGRRVAVTGRLEYREWKDQQDNPHSRHEVIADQVECMDPPKQNGPAPAQPDYALGEEPD